MNQGKYINTCNEEEQRVHLVSIVLLNIGAQN